MASEKIGYARPKKIIIFRKGEADTADAGGDGVKSRECKEWWHFSSLPSLKDVQKHSPCVVRVQDKLRPLLERGMIAALVDAEWSQRHDYLHHRGSGLDAILARICAHNNVCLFVDIDKFRNADPVTQGILLGRIRQNMRLARKFGIAMFAMMEDNSVPIGKNASKQLHESQDSPDSPDSSASSASSDSSLATMKKYLIYPVNDFF